MNSTMVRGVKKLPNLAPERTAKEPLEGDAFNVFTGV
jgi:hypothetical protein